MFHQLLRLPKQGISFSLSERDDDSNRLYPAGQSPNTHLELGLRPCHLRVGHGTVFWHDTARNILGRAGMTRTRGSCRFQNLGTTGYMARLAS
jgi:hypothetical protein